jgi:hypothetical protein
VGYPVVGVVAIALSRCSRPFTIDDGFIYAQWRSLFFSPTHATGEEIPQLHEAHVKKSTQPFNTDI